MSTVAKASLGLLAAIALLAAATAQADVRINTHDNGRIDIEEADIVITADDGTRAKIDPTGDLKIRGKEVQVTEAQRQLLVQYSQNLLEMEKRGEAAKRQAWRMAGGIMVTALHDLFTGASDTEKAAKPLKDQFLELCDDVKAERMVQDQIGNALPAFKPYAVIHEHDTEHNCHGDDKGGA